MIKLAQASQLRLFRITLLVIAFFALPETTLSRTRTISAALPVEPVRAMWVWNTRDLFTDAELTLFVAEARAARITDVYLFLRRSDYALKEARLRTLLSGLAEAGIRSWGLEGWRGYFSDVDGPSGLYAAADALLAYNSRNVVKFVGFHADMEPHDQRDEGTVRFHNGIPQSELTPEEASDRDAILAEWLTMHETLLGKMRAAGLRYGGSMPSWADDYYGEPVMAIFKGVRRRLIGHLMPLVPEYVVMSYNTNPANVIYRVTGEFAHAARLNGRARVMFSLETHAGVGLNVSYADTPPKNSKAVVLSELASIGKLLSETYPGAYLGWAVHDWEGWKALPQ